MKKKNVDLHMHSYYSDDGEFSPTELVKKCEDKGIQKMSITDHNCVCANEEGERMARAAGITYLSGIEIDCTYDGVNLHVLGYDIDYKSTDFSFVEDNIRKQRQEASGKMLLATQKMGFLITEDDMAEAAKGSYWENCWTGEMFAEILLGKEEYQEHPLLKPYRPEGERSDNPYVNFYWDFYSQGKPCYVKIKYPALADVVAIIHKNHGIAVLAHPGANLKKCRQLLEPIINTGLDGIEALSSYHTREEVEYYSRKAGEHKLLVTQGSDFHGKTKPAIQVGDTEQ